MAKSASEDLFDKTVWATAKPCTAWNQPIPSCRGGCKMFKFRLYNFELSFIGLTSKGMVYLIAHYGVLWEFMG